MNWEDVNPARVVVGIGLFTVGVITGMGIVESYHPDPFHIVCDKSSDLYQVSNITEVYGVTYPTLGKRPVAVGTNGGGSIIRTTDGNLEQLKSTRISSVGDCERVGFYESVRNAAVEGDSN